MVDHQCRAEIPANEEAVIEFGCYHLTQPVICSSKGSCYRGNAANRVEKRGLRTLESWLRRSVSLKAQSWSRYFNSQAWSDDTLRTKAGMSSMLSLFGRPLRASTSVLSRGSVIELPSMPENNESSGEMTEPSLDWRSIAEWNS